MTKSNSAHDPRLRGELGSIQAAAAVEAIAFGHPELDVDHLLFGLLATGGPGARALTASGAGLAALRRAVTELQEHDLRELGVGAAAPPASPVSAAAWLVAPALPVNSRAQDLLSAVPSRGDDRGLLLALLDDRSGRVERLLEHVGVDVDELRQQATRTPTATMPRGVDRPDPLLLGPAPARMAWTNATWSQTLPVPVDRVWSLISDVRRRPQWDAICQSASVDVDGTEHLTLFGPFGGGGRVVTQNTIHLVPGREITWRGFARATGTDALNVMGIDITPDGDGTLIHLYEALTVRAMARRLADPLLVRLSRGHLRGLANSIGQAAA